MSGMTNQERAAEVLLKHWLVAQEVKRGSECDCCAQALADAGLLMPDLPAPDDASIFVPNGAGWQTPQDSAVWTAIGGRVMIQRVEPGNFTPGESRSLALALLAAAKLAEESND